MIYVNRQKLKPPKVLTGDDSPAATELRNVKEFIAERQRLSTLSSPPSPKPEDKKKKKSSFTFTVYSHDEIKKALAQLFHGKCAYCETRYAATQPVDVEHFRPKAGVDEDSAHLGYYWLAASWDNLLPSCIDCNRERSQEILVASSADNEEPKTRELKLGKGNRFPLATGSARAQSPDDVVVEIPLLLDPCRDSPEEELEFTDDGIVRPKAGSGPFGEKARFSIEVYGLNRTGLVFNRLEVLRLLQGRMYTITCLVDALDYELEDNVRDLLEDLLSHEFAELEKFRDPTRPYSLMCRQVIDRFVAGLTGDSLAALENFTAGRE